MSGQFVGIAQATGEHANYGYNASNDDAVVSAASVPAFQINLAWGLFRDGGCEDGDEGVHYKKVLLVRQRCECFREGVVGCDSLLAFLYL